MGAAHDKLSRGRNCLIRVGSQDFVVLGELWVLEDVNDFEIIEAVEVLLADSLQVIHRDLRTGARPRHVKLQKILGQEFLLRSLIDSLHRARPLQ